jgi:hypothetical protein
MGLYLNVRFIALDVEQMAQRCRPAKVMGSTILNGVYFERLNPVDKVNADRLFRCLAILKWANRRAKQCDEIFAIC